MGVHATVPGSSRRPSPPTELDKPHRQNPPVTSRARSRMHSAESNKGDSGWTRSYEGTTLLDDKRRLVSKSCARAPVTLGAERHRLKPAPHKQRCTGLVPSHPRVSAWKASTRSTTIMTTEDDAAHASSATDAADLKGAHFAEASFALYVFVRSLMALCQQRCVCLSIGSLPWWSYQRGLATASLTILFHVSCPVRIWLSGDRIPPLSELIFLVAAPLALSMFSFAPRSCLLFIVCW